MFIPALSFLFVLSKNEISEIMSRKCYSHFIAVKSLNHENVTNIIGKQYMIVLYSHSVLKFIQTIYLRSAPLFVS